MLRLRLQIKVVILTMEEKYGSVMAAPLFNSGVNIRVLIIGAPIFKAKV